VTPDIMGFGMRLSTLRLPIALALMALALASCSHRGELPANSGLSVEDDDAFCRAGGKVAPGSAEYVACRRDRDAQRANVIARADKKQRDLGEYMLNNPVRP
jgi:hypothetical protein